jgi:hypothetical protein
VPDNPSSNGFNRSQRTAPHVRVWDEGFPQRYEVPETLKGLEQCQKTDGGADSLIRFSTDTNSTKLGVYKSANSLADGALFICGYAVSRIPDM